MIFLVATDQYREHVFENRGNNRRLTEYLEGYANPERIVSYGFVEGIRLLTEFTHRECEKHNLPVLVTGGHMTVDETYEAVYRHFGFSKPDATSAGRPPD